MSLPQCRGCHATIKWLRTPTGKAMPVDPEYLHEWVTEEPAEPGRRRITLMAGDGDRLETGYLASVVTPTSRQIEGYVPHWSTCPKAAEFKR